MAKKTEQKTENGTGNETTSRQEVVNALAELSASTHQSVPVNLSRPAQAHARIVALTDELTTLIGNINHDDAGVASALTEASECLCDALAKLTMAGVQARIAMAHQKRNLSA